MLASLHAELARGKSQSAWVINCLAQPGGPKDRLRGQFLMINEAVLFALVR